MRRTSVVRFLTFIVVASFALAGPLAPLAHAQQPAQPAEPAQAEQPAQPAQPAQPTQPDLFQETLKAQRASDKAQGRYNAEAAVVNVFLVPGRAITCAAGTVVGVALLVLSFGSGYRAASAIFEEGCGGKWIVKGDDLRPDTPPAIVTTDPGR
jgi:hypothetical protein